MNTATLTPQQKVDNEYTLVKVSITYCKSFDDTVGMVVLPYKTARQQGLTQSERDDIVRSVVQKFGFETEEEYHKLYPGRNADDSLAFWWGRSKCYRYARPQGTMYPMFFAIDCTKRRKLSDAVTWNATHAYDKTGVGYMLVTRPTINDMRHVYGFKTISNSHLWMCDDWIE